MPWCGEQQSVCAVVARFYEKINNKISAEEKVSADSCLHRSSVLSEKMVFTSHRPTLASLTH
jgi:hypothetical protein